MCGWVWHAWHGVLVWPGILGMGDLCLVPLRRWARNAAGLAMQSLALKGWPCGCGSSAHSSALDRPATSQGSCFTTANHTLATSVPVPALLRFHMKPSTLFVAVLALCLGTVSPYAQPCGKLGQGCCCDDQTGKVLLLLACLRQWLVNLQA